MQESEIRGQTNIIIQAYESLVGNDISLTVSEFISIRNQAESEISGKVSAISENVLPEAYKENKVTKIRNNTPPASHSMSVRVNEATLPPINNREDKRELKSKEYVQPDEPSDFDILKSVPDDWN